jgi:hypothetical protein
MRVVVDEGVPRTLVASLRKAGVDAACFPEDWRGLTNGKLLSEVEKAAFDCLVTNDRNVVHQIGRRNGRVIVIALPTNRRSVVVHRAADIADTIRRAMSGDLIVIDPDGTRRRLGVSAGAFESLPPVAPFRADLR